MQNTWKQSDYLNLPSTASCPPSTPTKSNSFLLTYSTGELARALLQQPDYLRLLGGCTSTADHSGTLAGQLHELILIVFQTNLPKETSRRDR